MDKKETCYKSMQIAEMHSFLKYKGLVDEYLHWSQNGCPEIDPKLETIKLLESLNVEEEIINKYQKMDNIDVEQLEIFIHKLNIKFTYDQRLCFYKIKEALS